MEQNKLLNNSISDSDLLKSLQDEVELESPVNFECKAFLDRLNLKSGEDYIKDTQLYELYKNCTLTPLSLEEFVEQVSIFIPKREAFFLVNFHQSTLDSRLVEFYKQDSNQILQIALKFLKNAKIRFSPTASSTITEEALVRRLRRALPPYLAKVPDSTLSKVLRGILKYKTTSKGIIFLYEEVSKKTETEEETSESEE